MLKLSTATPGQIATKLFLHPLDPNMAATFDGRIWTRYVARKHGAVIGEWRELTSYSKAHYRKQGPGVKQSSARTKTLINAPCCFVRKFYPESKTNHGKINAGKYVLECYLGRCIESWEVCRHGTGGPDDHSYLNVSPGDAVNNMIDDLENGKSHTNLTYMIEANNRIARIISNLTSTNETTQAAN